MCKKDLDYYINLSYKIEIVPEEDGTGFDAAIPALKGCVGWGETRDEALKVIDAMKRLWLEVALERGWEIPMPGGRGCE